MNSRRLMIREDYSSLIAIFAISLQSRPSRRDGIARSHTSFPSSQIPLPKIHSHSLSDASCVNRMPIRPMYRHSTRVTFSVFNNVEEIFCAKLKADSRERVLETCGGE